MQGTATKTRIIPRLSEISETMNRAQAKIYNELENTKQAYMRILAICRNEKPLNHKNASAMNSELHCGLRHMQRMQEWITEDQNEITDSIYDAGNDDRVRDRTDNAGFLVRSKSNRSD